MAIDRHELNKGIRAVLAADATLQGLIGNPVRIYETGPQSVEFPWVRVDAIDAAPLLAVFATVGVEWTERHTLQFTVNSKLRSGAEVGPILKRIEELCEASPSTINVANQNVMHAIKTLGSTNVDTELGSFGVVGFTWLVQPV